MSDRVQPHYIRHDQAGDRTATTQKVYAVEIATVCEELPDIRDVVSDHSHEGNRARFRLAFNWPDPKTGPSRTRAGMQIYRIETGKFAKTWLTLQALGSVWADVAQERWTSQSS